jgi:hypothetical protein
MYLLKAFFSWLSPFSHEYRATLKFNGTWTMNLWHCFVNRNQWDYLITATQTRTSSIVWPLPTGPKPERLFDHCHPDKNLWEWPLPSGPEPMRLFDHCHPNKSKWDYLTTTTRTRTSENICPEFRCWNVEFKNVCLGGW